MATSKDIDTVSTGQSTTPVMWFSQFTVFTFFGSTLSESNIGRFLVEHEFSFNNELSITGVVD
jgi:hypothetical protein